MSATQHGSASFDFCFITLREIRVTILNHHLLQVSENKAFGVAEWRVLARSWRVRWARILRTLGPPMTAEPEEKRQVQRSRCCPPLKRSINRSRRFDKSSLGTASRSMRKHRALACLKRRMRPRSARRIQTLRAFRRAGLFDLCDVGWLSWALG